MEAFDRRDFLEKAGKTALAAGFFVGTPAAALSSAGPSARQLRELARQIRGTVVSRSSPLYGSARLLYDTRFDSIRPAAVVFAETASDVAATVFWARKYGVHIVPRSGRHSYGGYSSVQNGVVVDVTRLNAVRTQPGPKAYVGAGARLIDVSAALWKTHEMIPGGSCPSVGIAGLTLGGGHGFSSRKFGLTSDNLRQVTMVTADGRVRVCNAQQNSDLFWASRGGGGGNFGIATSFVFRTHKVGNVTTFRIAWPWSRAAQAVAAWQKLAPHAPDGLFSAIVLSAPGVIAGEGQFYGSEAALRRILRPLLNTGPSQFSVRSMSYFEAVDMWAGCSNKSEASCHVKAWTAGGTLGRSGFKAKSSYAMKPMSARGIQTMIRAIERGSGGGVIIDSYGGAIRRIPKGATAFAHRNAIFSMQFFVNTVTRSSLSWLNSFYGAVRPFVSPYAYVNYIDPALPRWSRAYYGTNYPRLVAIKRKYDPHNLFHFAQSVRLRVPR